MLESIKKFSIIIVIAILFAAFCFSIADVIFVRPDYMQFCPTVDMKTPAVVASDKMCKNITEPTDQEVQDCGMKRGMIEFKYDSQGCPTTYKCNLCSADYQDAMKGYNLNVFIIVSILAIIAIIFGMYMHAKTAVVEWVFSGILIGGIAALFIATMIYFGDMSRFAKPFVLIAEMALIIWVAVRTFTKASKK